MPTFDTLQQAEQYGRLAIALSLIQQIERQPQPDYEARYNIVMDAMLAARRCGWQAGIRIDPEEPEWPVIYIELPTGQITWHIPQHPIPWDKHTTEEKHARIRQLLTMPEAEEEGAEHGE